MRQSPQFVFESFRLDVADARLWNRDTPVHLGHKALAVLQRLLGKPGQLVTKDELFASAWPETAVSDAVLTTAMRELRLALGDTARTPRFIETVHRRGYRFIAPVVRTDGPALETGARLFVGREAELARLGEWYATAKQGARRVVFVAGDAGIGKTSLLDVFMGQVAAEQCVALIGRGQCIQQYGAGEAYLPLLEALGRMGRVAETPVAEVLRKHAPSWVAHLSFIGPVESRPPATTARMLRELAEALEILTAQNPLVLVLEDLHWSDTATLEWLAWTARRRDAARLLVVCTYRPVETLIHHQVLRKVTAELRRQPQFAELVLDYLPSNVIEAYVKLRFGDISQIKDIAGVLRRRTAGHPLFLNALVNEMLRQPDRYSDAVPDSVRQFIEYQFEQLSPEGLEVLAGASVAGDPFPVAAVAAATAMPEDRIEAVCAAWAGEGRFVKQAAPVTWPDGGISARFAFHHALYQEVTYEGISPERRARFHREIGERLERAYGNQATTIAAELAMHFERGREPRRALPYLVQAARNAIERSAYSEARGHLERGRNLLGAFSEGHERSRRDVELLLLLGPVLSATRGWAVEEAERVFDRARELSEELRDIPSLLRASWGLISVTFAGAEFRKAQRLGQQVLELAQELGDPAYAILGNMEVGGTAFHLGESTGFASRHFRQAEALYHTSQHRTHLAYFGVDMGLFAGSWASHFLWYTGYPDQARAKSEDTLRVACELSHPFTRAVALAYAAMLHQFRRDLDQVDSLAQATIGLCTEHGFPYYLAWAEVLRGWSRAARGASDKGIAEIRRGIDTLQTIAGARLPYYRSLLAEACMWAGQIDEAIQALDEGFAAVRKTEERWWEPELHRIQGELFRLAQLDAEASLVKALELARRQGAKSLELRAAVSLARLWRNEGRLVDSRRLVSEAYGWFDEGLDTADLRAAQELLKD